MKTYQEYYKEWVLSTDSRDLSFDEWLMLLLDRKEKGMVEKACEFFGNYLMEIGYPDDWCRDSEVQKSGEQRFREFMEE